MSGEDAALRRLGTALDQLADEEAAGLLAEARIEARARVRSLLTEALAERMLARAQSELAAAAQSLPADRAAEPEGEADRRRPRGGEASAPSSPLGGSGHGWYVYGVVGEGFEPPPMLGVDEEHELVVVNGSGLAALASRVSLDVFGELPLREHIEDLPWLERHARRHEQILASVRELRATVVPMRLFTIYESEESLRETLAREGAFLAEALERLDGCTEWGVKMFADPAEAEPAPADDDSGAGPGASYLFGRRDADRRSEESWRRLQESAGDAHRRLAALAIEGRVNPLQPPELSEHKGTMVMNGVYLVSEARSGAFAAEVTSLQEERAADGLEVVLTGPWPPYNFVNSSREVQV